MEKTQIDATLRNLLIGFAGLTIATIGVAAVIFYEMVKHLG